MKSRCLDLLKKMGILEALDPAGNAKKDSNVKVVNFWQKGQKVQGSKLNIFGKEWKRVQHPLS